MYMSKMIFTIFLSLIISLSYGQAKHFTTRDSLNMFCDKVMQTLINGKYSDGIQLFRQKSVLDTSTINSIDKNLNEQMANLQPYYKKIVGYEFIEDRPIKNSVVLRRYLLKFENYFLTVDFVLYNNTTGWTVSNFNYYDNPKELF
jgi:hypothetical protein